MKTSNYSPYNLPISIKGIVFENGKVWLRKNERNEWELPGGKIDKGEQPDETIKREILEELGFEIKIVTVINVHIYTIRSSPNESHDVFIVSYLCKLIKKVGGFEYNGEAGQAEFRSFSVDEIKDLNMPPFYKSDILDAWLVETSK